MARYVIRHHPGLFTELQVEHEDGTKTRVDVPDWTWAQVREYCRESLKERGIEATIERPEPQVEVFPWVNV